MGEIKDGGPAFPRPASRIWVDDVEYGAQAGMSLRAYFVAKAMQALIGCAFDVYDKRADGTRAQRALEIADAQIKAMEQ